MGSSSAFVFSTGSAAKDHVLGAAIDFQLISTTKVDGLHVEQ